MKIILSFCFFISVSFAQFDLERLDMQLQTTGLEGWIHGSVHQNGHYVFTVRNPQNFFDYLNFPLYPRTAEAKEALQKVSRHDQVRLFGKFSPSHAPLKHIWVEKVELMVQYQSGHQGQYQHQTKLPDELKESDELTGKVHAIAEGGKVLVVEYKDVVVPAYVKDPKISEFLYRNDIVKIQYKVRMKRGVITHLEITGDIEVLDSIKEQHGKALMKEGSLVVFPKSPQLKFDVYALRVEEFPGIFRNYTLVNFEDMDVFARIRQTLSKIWQQYLASAQVGRNSLFNSEIRLRVFGQGNVVMPSQANPQLLLKDETVIEEL